MKSETAKLIAEAVNDAKTGQYVCQFCSRAFSKESTLAAHQCEPRRRQQQKTEVGVSLGFQAWLRFYELTQGSAKLKNYDDFAQSQFYTAFVKFGRYCYSIKAIKPERFIDFVIKNNLKLDLWASDRVYERYLLELLKTESAEDALARAIEHMQIWAEQENKNYNDYFKAVTTNKLVQDIISGRISAWVVYNCANAAALLEQFTEEQIRLVWLFIDADFWQRKLKDYIGDTEMVKYMLQQANI